MSSKLHYEIRIKRVGLYQSAWISAPETSRIKAFSPPPPRNRLFPPIMETFIVVYSSPGMRISVSGNMLVTLNTRLTIQSNEIFFFFYKIIKILPLVSRNKRKVYRFDDYFEKGEDRSSFLIEKVFQ